MADEKNKKEYLPGNETYTIKFSSPLLRPGMEVEAKVSGRYVKKTIHYLLQETREFNNEERSKLEEKAKE